MEAGIDASVEQQQQQQSNIYNTDEHPPHSHNLNEPLSPKVPPKLPLLTTSNIQAAETNSKIDINGNDSPDGFYRNFKPTSSLPTSPVKKVAMASSTTNATLPRPSPSSLRSNGNGTTPRYPPLGASRNGLKPTNTNRSVSAPVADRAASKPTIALNAASKPSVKDLTKRFDQGGGAAASRKLPVKTGATPKTGIASRAGYLAARTGVSETPPPLAGRAGVATRTTASRPRSPTAKRETQRSRFTTEDSQSTNNLSSQARTDRSRTTAQTKVPTAQSQSNIKPPRSLSTPKIPVSYSKSSQTSSQTSPKHTPVTTPKTPRIPQSSQRTATKKPLFGEVISPEGAGYGINTTHVRSTSDSELHPPLWTAKSDDMEDNQVAATLPTRLTKSNTLPMKTEAKRTVEAPRLHKRSRSDFTGVKSKPISRSASDVSTASIPTNRLKKPRPAASTTTKSSPANSQKPSTSRIPSRNPPKFGSHSTSSSAGSTRPPSPSNQEQSTSGASSRGTPTRASTPVGRSRSRLGRNAPGRSAAGRSTSKSPAPTSTLNAYINVPEPKKSPPLRSSRPRQPLTSSTASSRIKAAERVVPEKPGAPHHTTGARITRAGSSNELRSPKKASDGHVDFAARRARIQKAVSKTISEAEKRELRRQTEKAAAAAAADPTRLPPTDEGPAGAAAALGANESTNVDTPTLTIDTVLTPKGMPGGFPSSSESDIAPQSALSATTDIDAEPQTEPPRMMKSSPKSSPGLSAAAGTSSSIPTSASSPALSADLDIGNGSIPIALAPSPAASSADAPGTPQLSTPALSEADVNGDADTDAVKSKLRDPKSTSNANPDARNSAESASLYGIAEEQNVEPPAEDFYRSPKHQRGASTQSFSARSAALSAKKSNASLDSTTRLQRTWSTSRPRTTSGSSTSTGRFSNPSSSKSLPRAAKPPPKPVNRDSVATEFSLDEEDHASSVDSPPPPPLPPKEPIEPSGPPVPPKVPGYSPLPSPYPQTSPTKRIPQSSSVDGLGLSGVAIPSHTSPRVSTSSFATLPSHPSPNVSNTNLPPITSNASPHPPIPSSSAIPQLPDYSPPSLPILPVEAWGQRSPQLSDATPSLSRSGSVHRGSQVSMEPPSEFRRASDDIYLRDSSTNTARSSVHGSGSELPDATKDSPSDEKTGVEKKRIFQRRMIITEFIDTEGMHCKDMHVVVEIYMGTAEACPRIEYSDKKTLFRNVSEIVDFSMRFLDKLKAAGSSVYVSRTKSRTLKSSGASMYTVQGDRNSTAPTLVEETDDEKDRKTTIGAAFLSCVQEMQEVYSEFLKNSELASARLELLQNEPPVRIWLEECGLAAKDLTQAWSLDALLVKPVQRIARYPLMLSQLIKQTPEDHSDYQDLVAARQASEDLLKHIDEVKKRVQTVGKITTAANRKRKESEVKASLAKVLRRDKPTNRIPEDETYIKLHERYTDDYLQLQVVLRDKEYYTRQVEHWTHSFLRFASAIELSMRSGTSGLYPEIESKWTEFNMSMRMMGSTGLDNHITVVRTQVIEPYEVIIKLYEGPGHLMQKRNKRRLDFEKAELLKTQGKKIDDKLADLVDQYEALNETLKLELPKLASLTAEIGRRCLEIFAVQQMLWYKLWQEKMEKTFPAPEYLESVQEYGNQIIEEFNPDHLYWSARLKELEITRHEAHQAWGTCRDGGPVSQTTSREDESVTTKSRAGTISSTTRTRGLSQHSETSPNPSTVATSDSAFTLPPLSTILAMNDLEIKGSGPKRSRTEASSPNEDSRPRSGRSFDTGYPRASVDSNNYTDTPPSSSRPYSGLFHSALPMSDDTEDYSSRASSHDRSSAQWANAEVLYLAASLFEFHIDEAKYEAGFVYLNYAAGEIFDVIAEKGELWLAKNQDDDSKQVGWIWSKHFARLATD